MNEIITEYKLSWTYKRVEIDMETMHSLQSELIERSSIEIISYNLYGMLLHYKQFNEICNTSSNNRLMVLTTSTLVICISSNFESNIYVFQDSYDVGLQWSSIGQ